MGSGIKKNTLIKLLANNTSQRRDHTKICIIIEMDKIEKLVGI